MLNLRFVPKPIRNILEKEKGEVLFPFLWNVDRPPPRLYIEGNETAIRLLEKLPDRALAIVGTRIPQRRSALFVEKILRDLKNSDLVIISGFARGIDAIAHENAIRNGIPTIAVLGTGLNSEYPAQNQGLRRRILEANGLLVTEFEPDDLGMPDHFIRRNRLIAQWSKATWVVEASARSGALNTAAWARNAGRFVFATPSFPEEPAFFGNRKLLERDHAMSFFNVESLGASWLEFANWKQRIERGGVQQRLSILLSEDSELLVKKILTHTKSNGGTEVSELLDWAIARGWTPQRFFEAAEKALTAEAIVEKGGMWVSC
ncbi:MAG: DNA-processing protein DprA [Bdellovibrionota bacterium]